MDDSVIDTFEITLFKSTNSTIGLDWIDNLKETYLLASKDQFAYYNEYHPYPKGKYSIYMPIFKPMYIIYTSKPSTIIESLAKIGGIFAIFEIVIFMLGVFHQKRFERILTHSITLN